MPTKFLEQEPHRLERLLELAEVLGQQRHFDEILRVVTQQTVSLLRADVGLIMMVNPSSHQTIKTVFTEGGDSSQHRNRGLHLQVCGWTIKNNQAFLSSNVSHDPRLRKDFINANGIQSVLCVPLRTEDVVIGAILLLNTAAKKKFGDGDLAYLQKISHIAAPFLRNVEYLQKHFSVPLPASVLLSKYSNLGLLGKSKKFLELLQAIDAAAKCDVRVLLEGQSGTGKELIARAIHRLSARAEKPFVAIDCGAIPASLLESELFGHVRGAFTGAINDRMGLLEAADGGTLFMDEIANLPMEMQAKLMRVLQEGEVRPLGSNKSRRVDVRIISASSDSLRKMVECRQFREDLFYRLHVYPICVPPLSERREDIAMLAHHFLACYNRAMHKQITGIVPSAIAMLAKYNWPGNIRELANVMERAVVLATGSCITPDLLPLPVSNEKAADEIAVGMSLDEAIHKFKTQFISKTLEHTGQNQSHAAQLLQIQRTYLNRLIKELGLKTKA